MRNFIIPPGFEFSKIRDSELNQFADLFEEALDRHPYEFADTLGEKTINSCSHSNILYGGWLDNKLTSICRIEIRNRLKIRHKCIFSSLYVTPRYRQKGIGHAMLHSTVCNVRDLKFVEYIRLYVNTLNIVAVTLYLSHGFEVKSIEQEAKKIGNAYVDEYEMELKLI